MPVEKINETRARSWSKGHYWDSELKGFGLIVRPTGTRSWVVQKSGRKRITLGHYPIMSATEARRVALDRLANWDGTAASIKGETHRGGVTFEAAMNEHLSHMRSRGKTSGATILERELQLHLPQWMSRPIASITKAECQEAHKRVGRKGEQTANRVMRHVRVVWNTCDRYMSEMDHKNPVDGVRFFEDRVRSYERIDLASFWAQVAKLENPIVQAWHSVAISTALRKTDINTMRWENVDLNELRILIPKPKGGEDRAFWLPISSQTADVLRDLPQSSQWVFPAPRSRSGHVENPAERIEQGEKVINAHWLRKEWTTIAAELETPKLFIDLMTNHAVPKNSVTDDYVGSISIDRLRPYQQKVSDHIFSKSADVKH